ncbi:MAG: cobalt ECF transporter T component CbiQ [Spirochaetia bacterium]|nr:cobalt ECF transporter T component CbiQ [Spirochaetota bacterium]MCX8097037.1 cobalt ECF transporter T component CbiQ [Spirochaetota bacterium]MDW8111768.1 cobalt ECF transporter T component CbiQ [Spirochaetia bacterium]
MCELSHTVSVDLKTNILRRIDARLKLVIVFFVLFANIGFANIYFCLFLILNALVATLVAKIRIKDVIHSLRVPAVFGVFLVVMQALWFKGGDRIEFLGLVFYEEGLLRGIRIFLTIVSGVWFLVLASKTSKEDEFLSAFKRIGIPSVMIDVVIMMYRYTFILRDEAMRIFLAQKVRLGYCSLKNSLRSIGELWGLVLVRSLNRASRVYEAMVSRGYNGKLFYESSRELNIKELALVAGYVVIMLATGFALKVFL